jgi:hypothetical protein
MIKKLIIGIVTGLLALVVSTPSSAVGTVTMEDRNIAGSYVYVRTFTATADSGDASFPATITTSKIDGFVFMVITNPGATGPTDDYDITLTDADGVDVAAGYLADRDISNSEQYVLDRPRYVDGDLTITITNNSVNSAVSVIQVFYIK